MLLFSLLNSISNLSTTCTLHHNPYHYILFDLGPRPLDAYKMAMPFRLSFGVVFALLVNWTHHIREPGLESFPIYYYITILSAYAVHQVCKLSLKTSYCFTQFLVFVFQFFYHL